MNDLALTITPGEVVQLSPLVRRITAPNPGPLTGPGTNIYLIGAHTVIDPGPIEESHIEAILQATSGRIDTILVTHTHEDHSPAAAVLAKKTGAKLIGCLYQDDGYQDNTFFVDKNIQHGEIFSADGFTLEAIYTPGHVGNHFCYLLFECGNKDGREEGMLFTGDHIMEGSTVVIIPPSGDMTDYIDSLKLLKTYPIKSMAPGHGHLIKNPMDYVNYLIAHRLKREGKLIDALKKIGEGNIQALTKLVYDDVDISMHGIASISLWAHLLKLEKEQKAILLKPSEDLQQQHWKSAN